MLSPKVPSAHMDLALIVDFEEAPCPRCGTLFQYAKGAPWKGLYAIEFEEHLASCVGYVHGQSAESTSRRASNPRKKSAPSQLLQQIAKRKAELENHPHTAEVLPGSVKCARCSAWITLTGPFHVNAWIRHTMFCSKIREYQARAQTS